MEKDGWKGFKAAVFAHAFLGTVLLLGFLASGAVERSERRGGLYTLSPDATYLEGQRYGLRLVDRASGTVRLSKDGVCHGTTFSPDSKEILFLRSHAPDWMSILHLVDLTTGTERLGPAADQAIRIPRQSEVILAGDGRFAHIPPRTVRIWDSIRQVETYQFVPFTTDLGAGCRWEAVAVSPDGRRVAVGIDEAGRHRSRIALWDLEEDRRILEQEFDAALTGLIFSPDGASLVATIGAYQRGEWILFDPVDGTRRGFGSMGYLASAAAFSPDSRQLAVCSSQIQIWDVRESRKLLELPAEAGWNRSLVYLKDRILAADDEGTVRSWDLSTGAATPKVWTIPGPPDYGLAIWILLAGGWLSAFWPFARKSSALRAAGTRYQPSFGGRLLTFVSIGAFLGAFVLPMGAPGNWGLMGLLTGAQLAAAAAGIVSFLAFLALRVPFRKRILLPLSLVLGAGAFIQLYLLAEISASC